MTQHSFLFVPGHRDDRFAKAIASGTDAVILDLEDAVAPEAKEAARESVRGWLAAGGRALVRINAADTPWFTDDLEMLRALPQAGVMLSKADTPSLTHTLGVLPGREVIALLETVAAFMDLPALSRVPGLTQIAFGSVDFGIDSGIVDSGDAMVAVRSQIVLHSRFAGLRAPLDGVSLSFDSAEQMVADALRSFQLGFGGKLCIHPAQVAAINRAFTPTEQEHSWAQRVLQAFVDSGGAATAVDGKMVDRPVVERARRIVAAVGGTLGGVA